MKNLTNSQSTLIYQNVLSVIIAIIFLFPLFWLLSSSFKMEAEIFTSPPTLLPSHLYLAPYIDQFKGQYNMLRSFLNSCVISLFTMIISLVLSSMAAYGLARFNFRGRKVLILSFLITQMLPATLILTPLFIIFNKLQFYNTYCGPIIADATLGIPFSVLMLRTYFLSIPKELDDSARVDGCNAFNAFWKIMLPIASPGVIVIAVFSFLFAWGDLIYANTFMNQPNLMPMTAGIYNFIGQYGVSWNRVMAFGALTVLPVVMIFIFMQKYIIGGLTSGAVKG
ncbi:MAG TPA: carbohydrate ABC transporter permease [Firmicutes bacterium]|jgi:multiple sugar transport system permease protein|nr:carbohydrate ABC transporter permease [Bacillota bacterium]